MYLRRLIPVESRFWANVTRGPADQCWEWHGSPAQGGYGKISVGRRGETQEIRAHRLSWEIHYGAIPDGVEVCHRCDNPPCVNPAHLFLGSHVENVADMVTKGRQQRGALHAHSKLSETSVAEMRQSYAAGGQSRETLAERYSVSLGVVSLVLQGKAWKHASEGDGLQPAIDVVLKANLSHAGSAHVGAKLNEAAVVEIRRRHAAGEKQTDLAACFGVSTPLIYAVVTRRSWAHVA